MVDLSRFKGLLVVGGGLLCAFVLCNAVLLTAFGKEPAMFNDPDRRLAWPQLELMGAQVAGVEQEMRHQDLGHQQPFGVVLGQSTTLRGIDPIILEQQVDPQQPWLLVSGFGSSFVKLHYYAQTLLVSDLQPDTIVLGLHATMLAGQDRDNTSPTTQTQAAGANQTDSGWRIRRHIKQMIWVRTQRKDVSHRMNMALFEGRLAIHRLLGGGAVGLFTPADEPWVSPDRDELPDRRPDAFLQRQVNGWRDFGWYDPDSYTTTNRHADAFRSVVAGCDALGPDQIIIVLMPVSPDLRGWLPPEAQSIMRELIDEVSVGRPIHVIDLRDAMPDDAFADYAHLNPAGREAFSTLLAKRLSIVNTED